jgi:hypothetical protein
MDELVIQTFQQISKMLNDSQAAVGPELIKVFIQTYEQLFLKEGKEFGSTRIAKTLKPLASYLI